MEPAHRALTGPKPAGLPARLAVIAAATLLVVGGFAIGRAAWSVARLTDSAPVGGNTLATAVSFDTTPPTISSSVISKTTQYLPGYVRQGGTYYVYANVTDASGVLSVTANVSSLTTGQTAVVLVAGSYSVGGGTYNYRSASVVVNPVHAEGTVSYSITATDTNLNSGTQSGLTVVVDNTQPGGADLQATNTAPGIVGRMEAGDVLAYTFSEVIDPESILSGWTGSATSVVVRLTNNGSDDRITVYNSTNTTLLPLGTIDTFSDFSTNNLTYGASGTPSTMTESGSQITITLGTMAGGTLKDTTADFMDWTPSASATDRAGNASTTNVVTESGASDKDF